MISTDEKNWKNGHQFRPERFLEREKYSTDKLYANIPFGVGRRICLGENLARNEYFLALVRFLQLTMDYEIVLGTNGGIDIDPNQSFFLGVNKFNIIFKSVKTNEF